MEEVINGLEDYGYTYTGFIKLYMLSDSKMKGKISEVYHLISDKVRENEIESLLLDLGIAVNTKGFRYLNVVLNTAVVNPEILNEMFHNVYSAAVIKYCVPVSQIERVIRHCIASIRQVGNKELLYKICSIDSSHEENRKVTNSLVIFSINRYLLQKKRMADYLADTLITSAVVQNNMRGDEHVFCEL